MWELYKTKTIWAWIYHSGIYVICMECEYAKSYQDYLKEYPSMHRIFDPSAVDAKSLICCHPDAPFYKFGKVRDNYICWFAKALGKCPIGDKNG